MIKKNDDFANDVLMADLMLRLTAMEKLLLDKGLFTKAEFMQVVDEIAQKASDAVMEKAKISKNTEDFIANLEKVNSKKQDN
jgi:hypothetical protein